MERIKRIIKFEFEDGTDVEFAPSDHVKGVYEVWVNGLFIETLPAGSSTDEDRAVFYRKEIRKDGDDLMEFLSSGFAA